MQQLTPNTLLQGGKYKIIKVLGQGGFGITYLAEQVMLGRKVAIKEFFMKELCERDESTSHVTLGTEGSRKTVNRFREKFLKEARNIARLNHPNIVRIIDVFEENGTAYYVMEYAENGSLADKVKKEGYLSEPVATRYILQVAEALDYIHQRKMNHLDIKPANIMLNEKDDAVLIDFGLSKQYDDTTGNQTSTTPVGISEGYAPMEQYKQGGVGEFSPETDIYALGATFFKLLTGVTPPSAMDIMENDVPVKELKAKGVSQSSIDIICKAMEGRKKDRMKDVQTFIVGLKDNASFSKMATENITKNDDSTILITEAKAAESLLDEKEVDNSRKSVELDGIQKTETECNETNTSKSHEEIRLSAKQLINDFHDGYLFYLNLKEIPKFVWNSREENCNKILAYKEQIINKQREINEQRKLEELRIEEENNAKRRKNLTLCIVLLIFALLCWWGYSQYKSSKEEAEKAQFEAEMEATLLENKYDNNHECVDLGLSVKWATCNIGAKSPEQVGGYYAWGESKTKDWYECDSYFDSSFSLYCPGGKTILDPNSEKDAAHALWGGSWHIPSCSEFAELIDSCEWYKETVNNVQGYKIEGKNGNSIFLPLSGVKCGKDILFKEYANYWTNELCEEDGAKQAYCLGHDNTYDAVIVDSYRANGLAIRPVTSNK